jgi:16S rRNA processing protein RimM
VIRGEPIVVGRIAAPYGIKGWLRIASFTVPPENLLHYTPWLTGGDEGWQVLDVEEARPHGRDFVARVAGCDDRSAAERFAGRDIAVPADVLPTTDVDEFYWKDLIGLEVVDSDGRRLGTVASLMETGANDVLVVQDENREHLIPFCREFVTRVELDPGRIEVSWNTDWETD